MCSTSTMPIFKKTSSSDASSLFDVHRRALHQCRSIFLKDLHLSQVTVYMSLHDNSGLVPDHHDNAGATATHDEQVAQFLDLLEMRGQRSFGVFLDYLKENQKHLHLVLEETVRSIVSLRNIHRGAEAAGDPEGDAVMSGETVRRLLQRKKDKSRKTNSDPSGGESTHSRNTKHGDADDDDDGGGGGGLHSYIDCYTVATRGRQQMETWIKHDKTRKDFDQKDEKLLMCVLTSDALFHRIDLSSDGWSTIPDGVRIPLKKCSIYVCEKQRDQHVSESCGKTTSGDKVQQGEMNATSAGSWGGGMRSQLPPPVPPKPSHLPLMGLNRGLARARMAEVEDRSAVVKPAAPKLPPSLPRPSSVNCRPSGGILPTQGKENEKKTPDANGKQDEVVRMEGRAEEEEGECCLDYNVSTCSASDLAFDPGQKEEVSGECECYEPIGTCVKEELVPLDSLFSPLPTYSTVDLEKKTSRKTTEGGKIEEVRVEVLAEDGQIAVTRKEKEAAKIPEKSPVDSVPDEASPFSVESEMKRRQNGHDLTAAQVVGDPPLPVKQLSNLGLRDDEEEEEEEEDSSGSNSYYEDIDVHSHDLSNSSTSAGVNIYLDPQVRQRTFSQKRNHLARIREDLHSPLCKLIHKGSLLITEAQDACPFEIQSKEASVQSSESSIIQPTRTSMHSTMQSDIQPTRTNEHPNGSAIQISTSLDEPSSKLNVCDPPSKRDLLEHLRGTRLAYDKDGHALYVPLHLLKRYGEPDDEAWFYPLELTSRQATLFLRAEKLEGCFVVYRTPFCSPGVAYNLSVCLESGDVVHYHVVENIHGDVMIEGHDHTFMTIIDLVNYFSRNKASLATRLRRPLKYAHLPISPGFHYDLRYELERRELSLTGIIIGQGNFGVVCAGVYRNQRVAVKVLQQTDGTLTDEDDFLEEAKSLMGLGHEHIVRLVGVSCTTRPFFIVTEFASKGSVKECLRNGSVSCDSLEVRFDICNQMVSAMTYLEGLRFLLHRDLASRNFLLTDDFCVKLADFGRARLVTDDWFEAPRKERVCIKWAAPEVLIDSHYSTKSDVWAMGVVLWEVFSRGERPYSGLSGEQTAVYVVEGGRLDRPQACPPDIYQMMRSCWKEDPRDRPTFQELFEKLRNKSSVYFAPFESLQNQKLSTITDSSQATSSKPTTPCSTAKLRVVHTIEKKANKLGSPREEERRNSVELRLLGYRNRAGTSSSEASIASGSGFLDVDREEDLTRSDRIRKSFRSLMKIRTTKKKNGSKTDVAIATRTPTGGSVGRRELTTAEL